ncbi:Mbeg1-like protein [Cellulosilyticum ruminicola]|uniref:Mbeg1-like protein n=1 Tax=Cellulosilyticum ruminicola TaxID=425254 RepID=UPI0006D18F59|nr:Mbeg1-like protein [Cellulosilyticum ruminicola]
MANIVDYLIWRGDLTFAQAPFNEIDNLILSLVSYINFDGIVPGPMYRDIITLEDASKLFFKMYSEEELKVQTISTKLVPFILKKVAATERFRHIGLCKYVSTIDYTDEKQFAALHILLGDGTTYISYRGTDDTLVGWKEDLKMTYITPVPAQIDALAYLEETTKRSRRIIRLGGHSKGGNLAMYAGIMCHSRLKRRILKIYNNDGPGFNKEIIESKNYREMLHKIKTIVPESSVVGMLLEHEEEYLVIKSGNKGILQHDIMEWEVMGNSLIYLEGISENSKRLNDSLTALLGKLEANEKQKFIETVFEALEATGARTVNELMVEKIKNISVILKTLNTMDEKTKDMVTKTIMFLAGEYSKYYVQAITQRQG